MVSVPVGGAAELSGGTKRIKAQSEVCHVERYLKRFLGVSWRRGRYTTNVFREAGRSGFSLVPSGVANCGGLFAGVNSLNLLE
jgi:hypothetical protein